MLRAVAIAAVVVTGCSGGQGSLRAPPEPEDTPMDPAALARTKFCATAGAVDRVDLVLRCYDPAPKVYVTVNRRAADGWSVHVDRSDHDIPQDADVAARVDRYLAAGAATICAGGGEPGRRFPSFHKPELGWPLDACIGAHHFVLHRGTATLDIYSPLTLDIENAYWLVGLHGLGYRPVYDDDAPPDAAPTPDGA